MGFSQTIRAWKDRILAAARGIFRAGANPPPASGFLRDYAGLKPDPDDTSLLWWEKPRMDWSRYRKLMIEPLVVCYHPDARGRALSGEDLEKMKMYFRDAVTEKLNDTIPLVNEPGPDVLRVRAAITDVIPSSPTLNVTALCTAGVPLDMGGAAIEAEFSDSRTGEILGSLVDRKMGSPMDLAFYKGLTPLGYAKGAFREWASELKKAMQES